MDLTALQQQFQDFLAGKNTIPALDKGKAVIVDLDASSPNEKQVGATNLENQNQAPTLLGVEGASPSTVLNQYPPNPSRLTTNGLHQVPTTDIVATPRTPRW